MKNLEMKYTVSEVAGLFGVDKETVKKWVFIFSDYLSSGASPGKGKVREFLIDDIRTLAYVSIYWEDDPDIEYIKIGLNSNSQFEDESISKFITRITPFFRAMPENIDETWRGVVFGGEFVLSDIFTTAESFKLAGDKLVEIAFDSDDDRALFQPAIYNYRHATELYIKAFTGIEKNHNLSNLFNKLQTFLKEKYDIVPPEWFANIFEALHYSDPKGEAFRYGITVPRNELYADMNHIKTLMEWLSQTFRQIKQDSLNE